LARSGGSLKGLNVSGRTTARHWLRRGLGGFFSFQMMLYRFFVEVLGLPLDHLERTRRALTKARAEAVTVFFRNELRFAVNEFQSAFRTGNDALAAAVALFFVYFYDIAFDFHVCSPIFGLVRFLLPEAIT
jgi:hypothetical protein